MNLFAEQNLSGFLEGRQQALLQKIESEPPNELLNVNESDFVRYLVEEHRIEPITFMFEALKVSSAEKLISAEEHPAGFHCPPQGYPRQVIAFHLPFTGEAHLLKCKPSNRILWSINVVMGGSEIRFEQINWRNDAEALKREKQGILENIATQNANVTSEVGGFNGRLEELARQAMSRRKAQLLDQFNVVASLGVALRKVAEAPQTFAVPIAPRKLALKPSAPAGAFAPDPALDEETYQDILSILHDVGVAMERLPVTHASRREEALRDFLLMALSTHYPNSTGETFNKGGRTDILVRHGGSNIFVAECKFWHSQREFQGAIDQLLGYLTWRESKAAIVAFVPQKKFAPALQQIMTATCEHRCFIRLKSNRKEGWMDFEFRLASDPTRNVHLAVLCFHFPGKYRGRQ